jgi:hypothetical protein
MLCGMFHRLCVCVLLPFSVEKHVIRENQKQKEIGGARDTGTAEVRSNIRV